MIFAAGLSPAWQQILRFEALRPGEVNRAREACWCASGKVLNVAVAAAHLGEKTSLVSAVGGRTGEAIAAEIGSLGIAADWIEIEEPTRICTTILEDSGITTELVENAAPISQRHLEEFVDRFRIHAEVADVTVLTGSLPANAPADYYARLVRNVPARLILDIRGEGLVQCLPHCPFLVKPNREELHSTVGRPLDDEPSLIEAMRSLNSQGAEWVVVTDGPRRVWVTSEEQALRLTPPQVDLVNPIGCGDCLAAGIAVALRKDDDVLRAVRFGMGAAAHNAEQLLPARLDRQRCEELAGLVAIQ